jgi:hypothetical protein
MDPYERYRYPSRSYSPYYTSPYTSPYASHSTSPYRPHSPNLMPVYKPMRDYSIKSREDQEKWNTYRKSRNSNRFGKYS